jgi:hypothetical protein
MSGDPAVADWLGGGRSKTTMITKIIRIFRLVANDVASVFPYFLAFYLISLFVSIFFPVWRGYFSWPAFHLSVVALALISLGSEKVRIFLREVMDISQRGGSRGFKIAGRGVIIAGRGALLFRRFLAIAHYAVIVPVKEKILFWKKNLGRSGYYKLAAILLVLAFSLFQGIYVIDFFVLLFGLLSVLFVLDMRISAGCALVLLAACPILLAFNQNGVAEAAAVYAYYFLVIAVFTGIGDHIKVMHRPVKASML